MKWYWWVLIVIVVIIIIGYFVKQNKSSKGLIKQDLVNKILEKCKTIKDCDINESVLQMKDISSLQSMLIGINDRILH